MLGIRTYIEAGVVVVLLGLLAFFKLEAAHRQHTIDTMSAEIAAKDNAISAQNASIEAYKATVDAANKARDTALAQAKKNAQSNYNRAKMLQEAAGSTCEDAQNLFLESVK